MRRLSRSHLRWIMVGLALGVGCAGGTAWAAFTSISSNGPNSFSAAPDLTAPTFTRATVAKSTGTQTAARFRSGGGYYVYAQVTDTGNPSAGIQSVTANTSSFTTGATASAMTAGSYTVAGITYNYRSAALTANSALATGTNFSYTITAKDNATNTTTSAAQTAQAETYQSVISATSNLVSYWRLGEASGTAAADVKAANAGTYNGSPVFGAAGALVGDTDKAGTFDGVNDFVNVPDSASLDVVGALTEEAWIKVTAFDKSYQAILTKGNSAYRLQRNNATNTLDFELTGTTPLATLGAVNVNDAAWHLVTAVWSGSGTRQIYVDGALDAQTTGVTGTTAANAQPLAIGQNVETGSRFWHGLIDESAIYNRALTAAEVLDHYKAGKGTG